MKRKRELEIAKARIRKLNADNKQLQKRNRQLVISLQSRITGNGVLSKALKEARAEISKIKADYLELDELDDERIKINRELYDEIEELRSQLAKIQGENEINDLEHKNSMLRREIERLSRLSSKHVFTLIEALYSAQNQHIVKESEVQNG